MSKMSAKTVYTVILLYLCVFSVLSLYQNYSGAYGQNAYNQPKFGHVYNNTNLPSWQNVSRFSFIHIVYLVVMYVHT